MSFWDLLSRGTKLVGDRLSRGTELAGNRLSRGTEILGTDFPGGPVFQRVQMFGDQMWGTGCPGIK